MIFDSISLRDAATVAISAKAFTIDLGADVLGEFGLFTVFTYARLYTAARSLSKPKQKNTFLIKLSGIIPRDVHITLTYRGALSSNGNAAEKHRLRQHFHKQLKRAWTLPPLDEHRHFIDRPETNNEQDLASYTVRQMGAFQFAPLLSVRAGLVGEVSVLMLRPEPVGAIVHNGGGDIDNRVKTLFDALSVPAHVNQCSAFNPELDETPFCCLFDDDRLIKSVSVDTDVWHEAATPGEVLLIIKTEIVVLRRQWNNMGL